MLRTAGVPEASIRALLAEAAQQAGHLAVGPVAEAPPSSEELAVLPSWVRPLVPAARDALAAIADGEGRLYPEECQADLAAFLKARAHGHLGEISEAVVHALGSVARVRREDLAPGQEDLLPYLISQRDSRHLAHEDRAGIAHLVWQARSRLSGAITPGQLLTLAEEVGREVGATAPATGGLADRTADRSEHRAGSSAGDIAGGAAGFTPMDDATLHFAVAVVASAIQDAHQLGNSAEDCQAVARRALTNYGDTTRTTMTPGQEAAILSQATAMADRRAAGATSPTAGAMGAAAPAAGQGPGAQATPVLEAPAPEAEDALFFGPVRLPRSQASRALLLSIPSLAASEGIDPATSAGAAAVVSAIEQLPRIVQAEAPACLGRPLGGEDFLEASLPQVITAMHLGRALGVIPLPVSPGQAEEDDAPARLLRGVAIGAIYGPLVHDEAKATAAAPDAIRSLERQPPLTPMLAARLRAEAGRAPWSCVLLALHAVRPGQVQQEPGRWQALAQVITEAQRDARAGLAAASAALPGPPEEALDGLAEERLRLFLPFAAAARDDGLASSELMAQELRSDADAFVLRFLAEDRLARQVMQDLVPRYAAAMSEESGGGTALVALASAIVPPVVSALAPAGAAHGAGMAPQLSVLLAAAAPVVEARLVQQVVLARVMPRLAQAGALVDAATLAQVRQHLEARVGALVSPPYTPARIDAWAAVLTGECRDLLSGGGSTGQAGGGPASGGAAAPSPSQPSSNRRLWPAVSMLASTASGELVGTSTQLIASRQIVLPANLHGQYGALGVYRWNTEKVMPLAVIAGGFKGAADALKANSTTTIVGAAGTTAVTANQGSQLKEAGYGGVAGGFGIMSDYVKDVLQAVRPSVSVVNGQRLSVVLLEPVVINVPEGEFAELTAAGGGGFAP